MTRRWLIAWALALSLSPLVLEAKTQEGMVRLGGSKKENRWKYISKFGYDIGTGSYKFRFKLHAPKTMLNDGTLGLDLYLDEQWPAAEAIKEPCERTEMRRKTHPVSLNKTGVFGDWISGTVSQTVRPHIWYFVLHDCNSTLQNFTHRLKFEYKANQAGGSEFSIELRWMFPVNVVFLMGFTIFAWRFYKNTVVFFRAADSVHPVVWTLSTAMLLQYIAQAFHTLHLWRYSINGSGLKPLDVISEIMFMLSQVIQTSLLILIGLGYTLLQSKIGELDLMIPMCFMVAVVHVMLVGISKVLDDSAYKFHEHEGAVGWTLLVMRVLLYVWFLWAVQSTASEGGIRLKSFMRQFRAAGTIYFLAYPMIFLVTSLFAPYLRHIVISSGLMVMQMGSNVWLASLFLRRGDYFKVSTLNSSSLPGGCRVGLDKEE